MRYFLIAGEASGDLHASNLMHELKKVDVLAEFCFLGGDLMQAQGGKMVIHYREMAYMGFVTVLKNLRTVFRNINDCKIAISTFQPDVVILIDYPGFNLRIARFVKEKFKKIPVHYYISPKIWAWKEYRIRDIKKYIDKMFTIFPFETEFYKKHNFQVEYVGNPSVDSVSARPNQQQTFEDFCQRNHLTEKPVIALLAGSRKQEIAACLPQMITAASRFADFQVVISGAPGIEPDYYNIFSGQQKIPVIFNQTYELIQHAAVAVVNSGTATLETALIGTSQVVVYHVRFGKLAYLAKNIVLKTKFISLVNIIARKEVVKELIAHLFTVENIVHEISRMLFDENYKQKMLKEYKEIRTVLGEAGAAQRTAKKITEIILKGDKLQHIEN
ncbi:MAG: lipid-A-disaccharide synthase [Paludibacter sp.]|nr:lipid-A-disaccharide synthase [Paludibacter sp.]